MNNEIFSMDGLLYAELIRSGAAAMQNHKKEVNDLNVFPVPDGDTGDNMFMTIKAGAQSPVDSSLSSAAKKASYGMLTGAKGNSGVILSRIFAGIAEGLSEYESAGTAQFARAMEKGIEEAYSAVRTPAEGTILTVYRECVTGANAALDGSESFEKYFSELYDGSKISLEKTPEKLEVLRNAGVVDSGGAGLMYILGGMLGALRGEGAELSDDVSGEHQAAADLSLFDENSVLEYGYCTEFLLRLQNSKVNVAEFDESVLSGWLERNGDSLVFFRDGSIIKVHVHTMHPGEILNHCQKYGEFLTLKIENMTLQHSGRESAKAEDGPVLRRKVRKPFASVAVSNGEGIKQMFAELGADAVIDGGRSMNPSTGDFIAAFDEVNADTVFVFPNNSNVILAARQAAEMYTGSDIRVIESRTVGEGYAAMSMLDYSGSADEIGQSINEAMDGVVTGMVSKAGRNADMDSVEVRAGDYLGYTGKKIVSDDPDVNEAAMKLCESLDAGSKDIIIILRGEELPEEKAEELEAALSRKYRMPEIILTYGGQQIQDYIIIFE